MPWDTCDKCGKRTPSTRMTVVCVSGASHDSPAEYEAYCDRAGCALLSGRDVQYERQAMRDRLDGFARTKGKDWT